MNDDRPVTPRGIRNRNPGNIELISTTTWKGQCKKQTDGRFIQFKKPVWGIRAMAKTLLNYQRLHDRDTLRKIIDRWAPPVENDTSSYVDGVAHSMGGIDPDGELNLQFPQTLCSLISAMIQHENGQQPYRPGVIMDGIRMANE